MSKFEYCVVTLTMEMSPGGEISATSKDKVIKFIAEKGWAKEAIDNVKKYVYKEVIIANTFDPEGAELEILRTYTGNNDYSITRYESNLGGSTRILSSRPQFSYDYPLWNENYPIQILAKCFAKLGQNGWEVIEYKFNTNCDGFAQALLKRKIE